MEEFNDLESDQQRNDRIEKERPTRQPPDPLWQETGKRLSAIRKAKGLTQAAVSKLFQISNGQAQISAYERGTIECGRIPRQRYIIVLGANPNYLDNGQLPMFLPADKQSKATADQLLSTLSRPKGGNMRVVTRRTLGQFINTGYAESIDYPFIPGDCYCFPILSADMGGDYPPDGYVICERMESPSGLLPGRVYVFQTSDELLVRQYGGLDTRTVEYRLLTHAGGERRLSTNEVSNLYYVARVDKPVF